MRIFHIFYQFEIILEDAFVSNNVGAITAALLREKASKSLVNRLNKVANKELDRSVFKSVTLLLRAIEDVCQYDEDCFNCLARQGLVYKMLTWFERAADFLKMEEYKGVKDLPSLIETFFDFFLRLPPSVEDRGELTSVFLLHVGVVGTDPDVTFSLRLEAIRTINSILDNTTKEERRKLSMSKDHCQLLEQFAKVILNVGDYEMQVALSEALCRMTIKRSRKELTSKWFANPVFAEGFNAINDTEFEIDCRTFLNDLNSYFGDERRVFTFPCICVFLDTTELFMPEDEKLEHFWVDFNLGTSCISLFVNNPEGSLWESIHLLRADVFRFSVCDCDNQTILTVHLSNPLTYRMTKGKMVQIIFDSKHDILDAAKRVFESKRLLQSVRSDDQPSIQHVMEPLQSDLDVLAALETSSLSSTLATAGSTEIPAVNQTSLATTLSQERIETSPEDIFELCASSDTEVARAKTRLFSTQSLSSGGSTHSTPTNKEKRKQKSKSKDSPPPPAEAGSSVILSQRAKHDYTRKKPKTKSKLKSEHATTRLPSHPLILFECSELRWSSRHPAVARLPLTLSTVLPLSSPSSADEASPVKHRTPACRSAGGTPSTNIAERLFDKLKEEESLEFPPPSNQISRDSGFRDVTGEDWDESVFPREEQDASTPTDHVPNQEAGIHRKRPWASERADSGGAAEKKSVPLESDPRQRPRAFFPSEPVEEAAESMSRVLNEEVESEMEMGSGVIAAFQTFKSQLRAHFSSRYKKIEARSLQSLMDCQKNVTSLLGAVHDSRLVHLERFQATVVQELGRLENDCISLKEIECETVNFWQSESQSVRSFCDRQQQRLESLGEPSDGWRSSMSQREEAAAPPEPPQ
ncbi:synaptonemal complex protein 2-like isoform X2 [Oncorhynchus keta]|uniref:synaptonemal complex protein 2-like isoform X2 n=1 Tax=Oncorhynchus keta TaxID=8018 RepID=UPI0015FD9272|nr:synaptonemal complex protein 2-like isoform X2 [Oncorhynchus keta]